MQAAGSKKVYKGVRQDTIIVDFTITVIIVIAAMENSKKTTPMSVFIVSGFRI